MKVAIPTFGSRVSPRFDCAQTILLVTIEEGEIVDRETVSMVERNPLGRVVQLAGLEVDTVVCGGIHGASARLLADNGIQVIPWVTGDFEDALKLFLSGRLQPGTIMCPGGRRRRKGPPWCR